MGTRNFLWRFILSVSLCTVITLEGRDAATATTESVVNVPRSTNKTRTDPAANSPNASAAEPNTHPNNSLLGTASPMGMVGEGSMVTAPTPAVWEGSALGMPAEGSAASPAFPTPGTGTTAPSMGTESGTASSPPLSSATTSHSSSSSSSSSPEGSPAVTPSPQQSSTSSTTEMSLATTSHPELVFSSPPSTAGFTGAQLSPGTEAVAQGPATPGPVASTSGTSPASGTIEAGLSSTLGSSQETSTPQLTSTARTQGRPPVEVTATSSPTGSPSPAVTTASVGSSATIPPGEGESSTMNQGIGATTEPNTESSRSLPATSPVSTTRMVSGEGRTGTAPTTAAWEGSSPGTSPRGGAVSPAFPTTRPGPSTAPSTGTESGTASSLSLSSAVTSHSSSSSSPEGSPAVTPSPQQSSTSSTTEMFLATTSHRELVFSTAGVTGMESDPVTAEEVTPSPAPSTASTNVVASASITSPASDIPAPSRSSTAGSSTETPEPRHTSTARTQGQPTLEVTATSSPTGSPSPAVTTASVGSSATIPPEEGESSTMNQGIRTPEPTASTSHSLPSTSLATPSTTNPSISTSVNPSFTGTCSPITLSIQLQNVTSTMIQFSWKPQGGTGDSPYTVRLLGKPGETRQRILNETSTSFENLLSGHQYQISVDVSTCSRNVSTSLIVQTAAEVYRGTTRIKNEVFRTEYRNKSSTEFKEFEKKFIMEITKHMPQNIQELKNGTKIRIVINSIENGSLIVGFDIILDVGQNITKSGISDAFTEALNRSTVFDIDLQRTFVEARNSCEPGLNDCDQNAVCTMEGATYSCQCNKGFTNKSPQVPGRDCQQDLPSQHTTPAPPDTNTTNTTEAGSTTPAPPNTTTTNTTGTGPTTPAPPNTNTTNTTGTGSTTPAPPNTNTTGFTGSTSSSVFSTRFTSAPCMAVSVEVQKVTEEEIQLSWTSSSKGSLYNITLMDGKEINTETTNETRTVFKNLLPGHVYTISVAVSSCAEDKRTSVTVRTDPTSCFKGTDFCSVQSTGCSDLKDIACSNQALAFSVWFKEKKFNNTLYNSDSEDYERESERIKTNVAEGMQAKLGNDHFNVVILGFRPGSVIADFLLLLSKEEAVDVNEIQTYLSEVFRGKFGNQTKVEALSAQTSTDNSSPWRVAVIVLGVLLGVALVLILLAILFYIYVRRRSGMGFSTLYTW